MEDLFKMSHNIISSTTTDNKIKIENKKQIFIRIIQIFTNKILNIIVGWCNKLYLRLNAY